MADGYPSLYAQKLVEAGIEQIIARSVEQLRELEGERLDSALAVLVDKIDEQETSPRSTG